MKICTALDNQSYDILLESGVLQQAGTHLSLNRRVLVVTDESVPPSYAQTLASQCKAPVIHTLAAGEGAKTLENYAVLISTMLQQGFSRKDCVVAVGGGVAGDLAGFAASTYMRGIDFYNIPTTLLSQIDSSIGGKTAIDFGGVKNIVGTFYQPKKVLIDPQLLTTLPPRQIANGLAEAIKMALTSDATLFRILEEEDISANMEQIISRCLQIKKALVEQDEKETDLRRVLNFGHTIGHGIESTQEAQALYHGECVALGMLPMCDAAIRPRVVKLLKKHGLYRQPQLDWAKVLEAVLHDKKADGDMVTVTTVSQIGSFRFRQITCQALVEEAKSCFSHLFAQNS